MKTEISRNSRQAKKRYSGVYQQQGRMFTDSDVNEQVDINKQRLNSALGDVIVSGIPRDGGLSIVSDASVPDIKIRSGRIYIDGLPAAVPGDGALVALDGQTDFPVFPTINANAYLLYADVWERTVTALEDSRLLDDGLHGADTCTRTQTMCQIKWCNTNIDPESAAQNPQIGDAALRLNMRAASTARDQCDPCADIVDVATRTGNYLFRVEVHDVHYVDDLPASGIATFTLKWSTENGAEQFLVGEEPDSFKLQNRVYEFFNTSSEKHLGVHLATGSDFPVRGDLQAGYPISPPAGFDAVRRWDGYCTIDLTSNTLTGGVEHGAPLSSTNGANSIAHVKLGTTLSINLSAMTLQLDLDGKQLVAGDYWLGEVREDAVDKNALLPNAAMPEGIRHHYLTLASVDAGNVTLVSNGDCKRHGFPPLTDIRATDVCYDNTTCNFPDAQNVQDALDALCLKSSETCCTYIVQPGPNWEKVFSEVKLHQSAHICFMEGHYLLQDTVTIPEKGFLHITGSGSGTHIVCRSREVALRFENCSGVSLHNVYIETGSTGFSRSLKHLSGTVTALNCGEVVVENTRIKCAAGTRKAATCLTVLHDPAISTWSGKERVVRISNCRLDVGHFQVGLLLVNMDRTHVEGCRIATRGKPNSLNLNKQARDRAFAAQLTRLLISGAMIRDFPDPVADKNMQLYIFQKRKVQFKSQISSKSWNRLLGEVTRDIKLKSNQELLDVAKEAAENIVMNKSFRERFTEFKAWFDAFKQAYPAVISQAVVCAGQVAKEVRIMNNTIEGAIEGIRVAVSDQSVRQRKLQSGTADFASLTHVTRDIATRGNNFAAGITGLGSVLKPLQRKQYYQAGTVLIEGNVIRLLLPPWTQRQRQGIYIGNCNHLSVVSNHISVQRFNQNFRDEIDGIRVYGYLGRMMMIKENFMSHCTTGVDINALDNDQKSKQQWLVADNLIDGVSSVQAVSAPANVIQRDNVV